ncbi:hypothetical protein QBC39DRAFT_366153 [Podospora conica]|nr:hypothetical protein QBC39DRAFT_366153 [Schizothecium conicum]
MHQTEQNAGSYRGRLVPKRRSCQPSSPTRTGSGSHMVEDNVSTWYPELSSGKCTLRAAAVRNWAGRTARLDQLPHPSRCETAPSTCPRPKYPLTPDVVGTRGFYGHQHDCPSHIVTVLPWTQQPRFPSKATRPAHVSRLVSSISSRCAVRIVHLSKRWMRGRACQKRWLLGRLGVEHQNLSAPERATTPCILYDGVSFGPTCRQNGAMRA